MSTNRSFLDDTLFGKILKCIGGAIGILVVGYFVVAVAVDIVFGSFLVVFGDSGDGDSTNKVGSVLVVVVTLLLVGFLLASLIARIAPRARIVESLFGRVAVGALVALGLLFVTTLASRVLPPNTSIVIPPETPKKPIVKPDVKPIEIPKPRI
jgi:hypothetical protein